MNKFNIDELTNYLEELGKLRVDSYTLYEDYELSDNLKQQVANLFRKYSLLELLIIKTTTNSIVVKFDIEDELKRRVEDARKNND